MSLEYFQTKEIKKVKKQPISREYWPLGEGQGISATVWPNNLQLQRRVKNPDGSWQTTQEIALAKPILEKLYIRLPKIFEAMKEEKK